MDRRVLCRNTFFVNQITNLVELTISRGVCQGCCCDDCLRCVNAGDASLWVAGNRYAFKCHPSFPVPRNTRSLPSGNSTWCLRTFSLRTLNWSCISRTFFWCTETRVLVVIIVVVNFCAFLDKHAFKFSACGNVISMHWHFVMISNSHSVATLHQRRLPFFSLTQPLAAVSQVKCFSKLKFSWLHYFLRLYSSFWVCSIKCKFLFFKRQALWNYFSLVTKRFAAFGTALHDVSRNWLSVLFFVVFFLFFVSPTWTVLTF